MTGEAEGWSDPDRGDAGAGATSLVVATVLFEGVETLAETIPTWIDALQGTGFGCRIIDNSISDGPRRLIESLDWRSVALEYVRRKNPGFATSANEAITEATASWVFLLNPDVHLTPEAVASLRGHLQTKAASGSTDPTAISIVTNGDHTCGIFLDRLGYFSDRPVASRLPCLGPSGGAALFERESFRRSGGFDDDLFAWGEDAGLAIRLYASGVRTEELLLALDHLGGHSVASPAGQRLKARLLARNRLRVLRREYGASFRYTVGLAQLAMITANGLRKLRYRTARAHFSGMLEGMRPGDGRRGRGRGRRRGRRRMTLRAFLAYSSARRPAS